MDSQSFQIKFIYRGTTYHAQATRYINHFDEVYYLVQDLRPFRRLDSNIFQIDKKFRCFEFTDGFSSLKMAIAHAIEKACAANNIPCYEATAEPAG